MFYVKTNSGEKAAITSGNTFCTCPKCGKETHVDLEALSMEFEGDVELYGKSAVWCEKCSEKAAEERRVAEAAQSAQEPMFRAIDTETGDIVYLSRSIFEAECPVCGKMHPVELDELVLTMHEIGASWYDMRMCCDDCSAKRQGGNNHGGD